MIFAILWPASNGSPHYLGREDPPAQERQELAGQLIHAIRSLDGLVSNLLIFEHAIAGTTATRESFEHCWMMWSCWPCIPSEKNG